jgi:hypothetical protein
VRSLYRKHEAGHPPRFIGKGFGGQRLKQAIVFGRDLTKVSVEELVFAR